MKTRNATSDHSLYRLFTRFQAQRRRDRCIENRKTFLPSRQTFPSSRKSLGTLVPSGSSADIVIVSLWNAAHHGGQLEIGRDDPKGFDIGCRGET
ncbi:hypothetical protein Poly41_12060 [Novipirellula artificiosorum]|uniref:Uncharacterized protein n=1 Tax=Novipirellula artificiosorum TaxID=2528016 RepID=A0A5C6E2F1_9BACT|nr:hypothetical protein Poly41_12060 [Novipirellula artificiosorum]